MESMYSCSSLVGLVSSKRRWQRPENSCAMPKFSAIDLAWPMGRNPLGSGGNRVTTCRCLCESRSACTMSRMKSRPASAAASSAVIPNFLFRGTRTFCQIRRPPPSPPEAFSYASFLLYSTALSACPVCRSRPAAMTDAVTRFAPSPTGFLHIGGARTALFNWLYARKTGGKMLLRIEDTDRERWTEAALAAILVGLKWPRRDWDGDVIYQFSRAVRHREVAEQLLASGKAYRCYATAEE